MRIWFIASMLVAVGIPVFVMIALYFPLRSFRARYPLLRDEGDLRAFKNLATLQMYGALPAIYLMWMPLVIWLVGKFIVGALNWLDALLYVVVPLVIQFGIAACAIGTAEAVRATPAANDALAAERDRIVDVWVNQRLPKW